MSATGEKTWLKVGCFFFVGFLLLSATITSMAQGLYVTNLDQLVVEAYSPDYCLILPFSPWDWRAFSLYGGEPWWVDCSQMSCTDLFQSSTELDCGVTAYSVVLVQNALTGETTIQPDGLTNVVATVAASTDYEPSWLWNSYFQVTNCLDCWGLTAGDIPPPVITLTALLADAGDYATYTAYQSNLEAEAASAASAMTMSGGFFAMDDEDDDGGGDPCSITNLTQPFYVTIITQAVNRATTITWQSCQIFRYLVWEANSLSTNTQWFPSAYVWGATNVSSTTWTDTATTNDDGSTVTQRFYRVQRLLGSPIAAGPDFSLVIRSDGTLWAWGDNGGEEGDGLVTTSQQPDGGYADDDQPYPGEVSSVIPCDAPQTITNPVAVAAGGDDFSVVADENGVVWTFGEDDIGQLGSGVTPCYQCGLYTNTPYSVAGLSNIVAVAAGYQHALALRADGKVFAWGNNSFQVDAPSGDNLAGQLGITVQNCCPYGTNVPVECQFPTNVVIVAIAAGAYHSAALDTGGNVWTFGDNYWGQLGNGVYPDCADHNSITNPTMLTTISNVIAIAAGDSHTVALRADKTVWTWGSNGLDYDGGQLGRSVTNNTGENCGISSDPYPGQVLGLSNIVAITAGSAPETSPNGGIGFTVAVASNGQVYAWGDNTVGELGTNGPTQLLTPGLVYGISNAVMGSAPRPNDGCGNVPPSGDSHSLVMTLDQGTNHYWGFGDNTLGEIGYTATTGTGTVIDVCGNSDNYVYNPTMVEFCTRCQREIQFGSSGVFTAQCNGTLYLYYNDDYSAFSDNSGSFSVSIGGFGPTNLLTIVMATNYTGVAVGQVTIGNAYTFTASGTCSWSNSCSNCASDPNGNGTNIDCSTINIANAVCPNAQCFSLVGKIQ